MIDAEDAVEEAIRYVRDTSVTDVTKDSYVGLFKPKVDLLYF